MTQQTTEFSSATHHEFFNYYKDASADDRAIQRLSVYRDIVLRYARPGVLDVADIGCGAGTQSRIWAERDHRTHGVDIGEDFIHLARERAPELDFEVGSATALPWPDASMDVALAIELLEHVEAWQACLNEGVRVLKPGGVLFLTTTNALCPKQQEFDLPLYSWYPARLKRHYEHLARTTRPELATFATYPAVNWFTPYSLRRELEWRGCRALDRYDVADLTSKHGLKRLAIQWAQRSRLGRVLAHLVTPASWVLAVKR